MNRRGTEPYARWCERPGLRGPSLLDSSHENTPKINQKRGGLKVKIGKLKIFLSLILQALIKYFIAKKRQIFDQKRGMV